MLNPRTNTGEFRSKRTDLQAHSMHSVAKIAPIVRYCRAGFPKSAIVSPRQWTDELVLYSSTSVCTVFERATRREKKRKRERRSHVWIFNDGLAWDSLRSGIGSTFSLYKLGYSALIQIRNPSPGLTEWRPERTRYFTDAMSRFSVRDSRVQREQDAEVSRDIASFAIFFDEREKKGEDSRV